MADSSSMFSPCSQFKVGWGSSASSSGLAVVGSGLWVGFRCVSWVFVPLDQRLPGDVVFMAKEWQVHQSPAKSCHRFQVSTCIASITFHCQSKYCGQVQSQWDRARHSAYSGEEGSDQFLDNTPACHKVLGNRSVQSPWEPQRKKWTFFLG